MPFITLLVVFYIYLPFASTILQPRALQSNCSTCAPNPIANIYPNNVTGTVNATTSVIVVPLAYAQLLLPSHLKPLPHAYARFYIPSTHYPLIVESIIDHDIRYQGLNPIIDFSFFRLSFPFIDLLNDNSSCFKYTGYAYLPPTSPVAIAGTEAYGIAALPSTFDPANAPYKPTSFYKNDFVFSVDPIAPKSLGLPAAASVRFWPATAANALPLAFYRNITNQPIFGNNNTVCDNVIRFWNTSLSEGDNQSKYLRGTVRLGPPLVHKETIWRDVEGIRAAQAFLENTLVPCQMLARYGGTGEGDSG